MAGMPGSAIGQNGDTGFGAADSIVMCRSPPPHLAAIRALESPARHVALSLALA